MSCRNIGDGKKNSKLSVSLRKDRDSLPRESPGNGMEEAEEVSMNVKLGMCNTKKENTDEMEIFKLIFKFSFIM